MTIKTGFIEKVAIIPGFHKSMVKLKQIRGERTFQTKECVWKHQTHLASYKIKAFRVNWS